MRTTTARALSIAGHPLLLLPLALALPRATHGRGTWALLAGCALAAALVLGVSRRRVRSGRWRHVDASGAQERRELNRALLPLFALGAVLAWPDPALAMQLALGGAMVVLALATARWCHLSLHAAFAVYAAVLLWAWRPWAGLAMLGMSAAVCASRLALRRHAPRDLVAGVGAGLGCGLLALAAGPAR